MTLEIKVPVPEAQGYITLRDKFDWDLEKTQLRPEHFIECLLTKLNDKEGVLNDKARLVESILDQITEHVIKYS